VLIFLNWTSTAILSAAIQGAVSIIDSHLISKRMPGLQSFLLPVGIILLIFGLIVFYLFPLPEGTDILPILVAIAAGLLRTAGVVITLYNLTREEVSRVIPITYTYPVFVAIIAIPLLGESLGYLQWLAIIIVVAGAIIVSAEKSPSGTTSSLSSPFLLLFVASLLFALSDIFTKYVLAYISFWNVYSLAAFGVSVSFLIISIRPGPIKQLRDMKRRSSAMALLIFDEMLALLGAVLQFWAMARGPVSLVSTIAGTRPVFVAIYSIILSFVLPGFLIKGGASDAMALRLTAIAMIVGGVSIIYLT
jgi:drug/metabolite transporter (DMT)-like permease